MMEESIGHKNWTDFIEYISRLPEDPGNLLKAQSALFDTKNKVSKSQLATSAFEFGDIAERLSVKVNDDKILALGLYKLYVLLKRLKCSDNAIQGLVSALQEKYSKEGKESLKAFFRGLALLLKLTYNIAKQR